MKNEHLWNGVETRLSSLTSPDSLTGLFFVRKIFGRLNNPYNFPAIHIAGTNGKGSTAADLDAMLRAAGYKSALFTSPHLVNLGERLLIDGKMLSPEAWHGALDAVERAMKETPEARLGYFQILTAACFLMIQRENVDVAVIETGLGGRYDTSNILPHPLVSVITPLGMDHMKLLGNSLSEIAQNKFDIIKKNSRALYCGGTDELNIQFRRHCELVGAHGEILSETCRVTEVESSLGVHEAERAGSSFLFHSPEGKRKYFVGLVGLHQPENASLALRTLEKISDVLPVSHEAAQNGLANVVWPGRMEVIRREPDVILDGAHNPHGAQALIRSLEKLYGKSAELTFVYASMTDKDYTRSLQLYSESFPKSRIFCTQLNDNPRCEKAKVLAAKANLFTWGEKPIVADDPLGAIRDALKLKRPVIACGSLYFIGRIREYLQNEL